MHRQGCDLLHDGHGALPNERDRHRMGAHALARDTAGGVGRAEEGQERMILTGRLALLLAAYLALV